MALKYFHHWQLPVLSALAWWTMLVVLLSLWAAEGFPNYSFESKPDQYILYISDIGAGRYQPIFITGSSLQGVLFIMSLYLEINLRLSGRLRRHHHMWALWCTWGALALAIVGQTGIILVAIFDTKAYHDAHVSLLVVYIVFIGVSAILNVIAAAALDRSHLNKRHVRLGLRFKILWFCLEFALAVAFISSQAAYKNVPAVLEWTVSFVYPLYQLIIAWDLWPAIGKTKNHYPKYNDSYPCDSILQGHHLLRQKPLNLHLPTLPHHDLSTKKMTCLDISSIQSEFSIKTEQAPSRMTSVEN